jgi:hypothetical protein
MNPIYNRSATNNKQKNKLGYKINPAFFVNLQAINKKEQEKVKDRRATEKAAKEKAKREAKAKQQRTNKK